MNNEEIYLDFSCDSPEKDIKTQLSELFATMTPREEKILRMRFGLDDGEPLTLDEVAKQFKITVERVRQIERKAFGSVRYGSRSKKLKAFLEE